MWIAGLPEAPAAAFAEQLSALAPPTADAEPPPPAIPQKLPSVPQNRAFWQSDWALAAMLVGIVGCLLVLAVDRRDIAKRWPTMEKAYDHLGMHVYRMGEGLSLRQVRSEMRFEGASQLVVEGQVHNDTVTPQTVPPILAAAIGPDGKIMQSWQIDAPTATIEAGASVPFTSAIHAPQGTVTELNLHFIEPSNAP